MPAKLERCVRKVSKKIKPRKKGQSKKSAAYAVCTSAMKNTGKKKRGKKRK